ncbi:L-2-hydroxyglutarate oxidase [Bowmanella denitrificans]|uniref:L-2-hydroxyglutarate oxidase n=1 Tax=Bowmanella denitrificans TaxID=366582 RepID=A0ABN0WX00_9ALTE
MLGKTYDLIVVGAGILGAACARHYLQCHPGKKVLIIEKESAPARHQTGRNSGVVHAGVYYAPGSLKAQYCREGLSETLAFCQAEDIPLLQCGKLIVATDSQEEIRLQALYQRSQDNGLHPQWMNANALRQTEQAISGRAAILVRDTAITDYTAITRRLLEKAIKAGAEIEYSAQVSDIHETAHEVQVSLHDGRRLLAEKLLNCAGLMADRLIQMQGLSTDFRILPFRGEYYRLPDKYNALVKHLIYPVPDPQLPFLGVHLTRMIDGSVTVGPNAVLALAREGYSWTHINVKDCWENLSYKGFWPLARQYWQSGLSEVRHSLFKSQYLKLVQKYCPQIQQHDLLPYRHGVRAQAVTESGELLHDFRFVHSERTLHVGNAPSPAATSAMPIARAVVSEFGK